MNYNVINKSKIEIPGSLEFLNDDPEFVKLFIAITHTNYGFLCFTTPTIYGQEKISYLLKHRINGKKVVLWDGINQKEPISPSFLADLFYPNLDANVFIMSNFQQCAKNAVNINEFLGMLNLNRDALFSHKKLIVFGMTNEFSKLITLKAPDFRSFFMASFHFDITEQKII